MTLRALALGLAASATVAAGDGGPELAPPADLPAAAPTPTPPRSVISTPSARGPVLALPGLTTAPVRPRVEVAAPIPSAESSLPALDAPIEMRNAPPAARSMQPPLMESFPADRATVIPDPASPPGPAARREPASSPAPTKPVVPAARRPWYRGGPRPAPAPVSTPSSKPAAGGAGPVESRSDPAADAALKRRIERQARAAIGDRARALEVRVVGKQVAIEARGVRFIQKRGVRRALESLPALLGLRPSIAVQD